MFKDLSSEELFARFGAETYAALSEGEKLELFQEVVNREIAAGGANYSVQVHFKDLDPSVGGETLGMSDIYLNRERMVSGTITRMVEDQNGTRNPVTVKVPAANLAALETILHEARHTYQNAAARGFATNATQEQIRVWAANNFDVSPIDVGGDTFDGCQYLQGVSAGKNREMAYNLYYMNPTELDAHRYSQEKVMDLLKTPALANDPSKTTYELRQAVSGYEAVLGNSREMFGSKTIDKDVERILVADYEGGQPIPKDISPQLVAMIHTDMIETQQEIELSQLGITPHQEPEAEHDSVLEAFDQAQAVSEEPEVEISPEVSAGSPELTETTVEETATVDAGQDVGQDVGLDAGQDAGLDAGIDV